MSSLPVRVLRSCIQCQSASSTKIVFRVSSVCPCCFICSYPKRSGGRVVWIGFLWRTQAHTSNSIASRERFQANEVASIASALYRQVATSSANNPRVGPWSLCTRSLESSDDLWGQRMALISDLPRSAERVTMYSDCGFYSELPPTPKNMREWKWLYTLHNAHGLLLVVGYLLCQTKLKECFPAPRNLCL